MEVPGLERCPWWGKDPLYRDYHDREWGVPVRDDRALFEKLLLDGFQAGLSWITILRKRETIRLAFEDFDPEAIVRWDEAKLASLMTEPGIIRNRAKIRSAVTNARAYLAVMERDGDGGFARLLWASTGGDTLVNHWSDTGQVPAETPESHAMSKALKGLGFRFCGPTICYAFMQAVGIVNDHLVTCFRHAELADQVSQRNGNQD